MIAIDEVGSFGSSEGFSSEGIWVIDGCLGFIPDDDPGAFGLLDPSYIIRSCHFIPAFADGKTTSLMPYQWETFARTPGEDGDRTCFYVNM